MRASFAFFALLIAAQAVGAPSSAPSACVLNTRWAHQPPYWIARPDQPPTGYLAETLREAARRIGCDVRFREMNWARGMSELRAGRIDVIAGSVHSAERERFAFFTRPINLARNVLFLRVERATDPPLPTLSALADTGLTIGIQAGAVYGAEYARLSADPRFASRLRPISTPQASWRMVAEGRLDGLLTDEVNALVQRSGPYGQVPLQPVLVVSTDPSRVMVGRHLGPAKAGAFDAALGAMVDDGWLPRLREAWIPCRTDPATMGCRFDPLPAGGADMPPAPSVDESPP